MAKKETNNEHGNELLENPEVLAEQISKTEELIEENKTVVISAIVVIALAIGGYFFYNYYMENKNMEAQSEMFQAVYYFEADSLSLALDGDGNNLGFKDIVSDYSGTDAANLANFYAGAAYLKQGDFKSAILYLEDFSSSDLLIQSRAYSLLGDANMELADYAAAAGFYNKAAANKPNKFFSPQYLLKAGLANEKMDDKKAAIASYQKIVDKYWDATEANDAKKHLARLGN